MVVIENINSFRRKKQMKLNYKYFFNYQKFNLKNTYQICI